MRFSIIVPVYNSYKYMPKCINSILKQSFKDFEVIIVDDGSTDKKTINLCNKYSKLDKRIRVIHKKNGGISSSRNKEIDVSNGEYICFVDGDDYVHKKWLSSFNKIIEKNKQLEFIIGRTSTFIDGTIVHKNFYVKNNLHGLNGEQALIKIIFESNRFSMGVRGMYKRKFVKGNKLYFLENTYYEDIDWTFKTLMKSNNVASNEKPYYYWRKRSDSVSTRVKLSDARDIIRVLKTIYYYKPKKSNSKKFRIAIAKIISVRFITKYVKYSQKIEKNELESFIKLIKKSAYINYAQNIKSSIIKLMFKFFGIKNTTLLIRNMKNIKNTTGF